MSQTNEKVVTKKGCSFCRGRGLVRVVMAYDSVKGRYVPVKRNVVRFCDGQAYTTFIPCDCPKGMRINEHKQKYALPMLRKLLDEYAHGSVCQADDQMIACMRCTPPSPDGSHTHETWDQDEHAANGNAPLKPCNQPQTSNTSHQRDNS